MFQRLLRQLFSIWDLSWSTDFLTPNSVFFFFFINNMLLSFRKKKKQFFSNLPQWLWENGTSNSMSTKIFTEKNEDQ